MKLKELKKILDKLTPEQLNQELMYNSEQYSVSGIAKLTRAKASLYNNHEDDPCLLKTMKELKEYYMGDKDEIEACDLEIKKGEFFIEFN